MSTELKRSGDFVLEEPTLETCGFALKTVSSHTYVQEDAQFFFDVTYKVPKLIVPEDQRRLRSHLVLVFHSYTDDTKEEMPLFRRKKKVQLGQVIAYH